MYRYMYVPVPHLLSIFLEIALIAWPYVNVEGVARAVLKMPAGTSKIRLCFNADTILMHSNWDNMDYGIITIPLVLHL